MGYNDIVVFLCLILSFIFVIILDVCRLGGCFISEITKWRMTLEDSENPCQVYPHKGEGVMSKQRQK